MKAVTSFLPYVLPFAMGCPKPVARRALVDAAIEFCEKSELVQKTLEPISVAANQPEYDMYAGSYQQVFMPRQVWFKTAPLIPRASRALANIQAFRQDAPEQQLQTDDPVEYFESTAGRLGLYPAPKAALANALTVRAVLRPKRGTTQLEDMLFDNWVEVIAAGALVRILGTVGQAYSDQGEAARRQAEFLAGIARAKRESNRGRVPGELRVQMTPFA